MTTPIYEWPNDWYIFDRIKFSLRSRSQSAERLWTGSRGVYGPHAQLWAGSFTLPPRRWNLESGQSMAAFLQRLDGQAGLIRIGDQSRLKPHYNRVSVEGGSQAWSDGTFFDDGTGWQSGLVPPVAFVLAAASRGDRSIQIGGLPVGTSRVLRRGDLMELRPNGIPTDTGNLYQVMVDGHTNSAGETGVEIRPALRQGFAAGDMVVLDHATSVFRLIDDGQGEHEFSHPAVIALGFSVIENVP